MYCGIGSCDIKSASSIQTAAARSAGIEGRMMQHNKASCRGCKSKNVSFNAKGDFSCSDCSMSYINGKVREANNNSISSYIPIRFNIAKSREELELQRFERENRPLFGIF